MAFRTREVCEHVHALAERAPPSALGVDGGLASSDVFLQMQADLLCQPVRRHTLGEATAGGRSDLRGARRGAAGRDETGGFVAYARTFEPSISGDEAAGRFAAWKQAAYGGGGS